MKKIFVIAISMIGIFAACNKADVVENTIEQDGKDCLVSFNPIGEITSSISPMSKGSALTDDIYLVQVYKGSEKFALGYFDNLESMKLYLKQGGTYRIVVAMVKNAKNLLGSRFNLTQNSINVPSYYDIFNFDFLPSSTWNNSRSPISASTSEFRDYNGSYYYPKNWRFPLNEYQYAFKNSLRRYDSSSAASISSLGLKESNSYFGFTKIENACFNGVNYPTCTDWFYGEVNNYTPTGDYETLDMSFKRVGFKLKYELSGVTDGEVTVKVYNSTRTFIENTTNTSTYSSDTQFIAFYDTKSAWQYADDYSENMTVGVVWTRGIGVTQDLGTKVIQVKRNCLNNIKIALGSDDRGAGVNMSLEPDSSMDIYNTDIPVE